MEDGLTKEDFERMWKRATEANQKMIEERKIILECSKVLYYKEGLKCERDTFIQSSCRVCQLGKESKCALCLAFRKIEELCR